MNPTNQHRSADTFHDHLGDVIRDALVNPDVIEVMANASGQGWRDRLGVSCTETGQHLSALGTETITRLVVYHIGEEVSEERPLIADKLQMTGQRFQGRLPQIASAPNFTIRKRPGVVLHFDGYFITDTITDEQGIILLDALSQRRNSLVSESISSGRAIPVDALLAEPSITDDRIAPIAELGD